MIHSPAATLALVATISATGTFGAGHEQMCSPDTLRVLSTKEYEHRIWTSLSRFRDLEAGCRASPFSGSYLIYRAQLESFVGNHHVALRYADRGKPGNKPKEALENDTKTLEAVAHLTRLASVRRIVMVNERHHVSTDRLLTLSLLKPLAERGFGYLALEAAWNGDDVNERGYAIGQTGYYINDVVFAEVVREAIALGYQVVAYEIEAHQRGQDVGKPELSSQGRRDYWQARNLVERTFARDPKAKVLVHCGYDHLKKSKSEHWAPMGYFLKEMTGLEPLTVDQVRLSERGATEFEHALRTAAERQGLVQNTPVVLADGEGRPLRVDAAVDVHVLTPRTRYQRGRPTWMEMLGRRHGVVVKAPLCERTSCIVEARDVDQPDAVPFDRLEVSQSTSALLYLPLGADVSIDFHDVDTQEILGRWQGSVTAMSANVPLAHDWIIGRGALSEKTSENGGDADIPK